jgi:hypothetical protein
MAEGSNEGVPEGGFVRQATAILRRGFIVPRIPQLHEVLAD